MCDIVYMYNDSTAHSRFCLHSPSPDAACLIVSHTLLKQMVVSNAAAKMDVSLSKVSDASDEQRVFQGQATVPSASLSAHTDLDQGTISSNTPPASHHISAERGMTTSQVRA